MRINGEIINTAVKAIRGNVRRIETPVVSNPLIKAPVRDVLIKDAPLLRTPLTQKEIMNMKPSEFQELLASRCDIPENLRVLQEYQSVTRIHSPEQLSLYDEINNVLLQNNVDFERRKKFLEHIMYYSPENAQYSKKLLPKLLEKGYDLELLAGINITEYNYKFIEAVLKKQPMWKAKIDKLVENLNQSNFKNWEEMNHTPITQEVKDRIIKHNSTKPTEYEFDLIQSLCRNVDKDNVKFLDEWNKYTDTIHYDARIGGIGQHNTRLLDYWNKDTLKILQEFSSVTERDRHYELLEVIARRGHDYNSVKRIFRNNKITGKSYVLLEFKNLEKFKNISLDNFDTLTVAEKKEFINAFISALSIKNVRFKNYDGLETLKANIRMFEHIDTSTPESCMKTYSETLKKMIESIPRSDRDFLQTKANWGVNSKAYREANPIPALVDDLEKLPYRVATINGKKIKVSEITNDTKLAISGHCTSGDAFLNVEALEFTDPNEILCVGTKWGGGYVHYGKKGYSIALKPRQGRDFWIQSKFDVDSGNNATKNVTNVSKMFKGNNLYFSYIPDLIKKELNLSHNEYTLRIAKIKDCTTLDEIGKIDKEMEEAIRRVLANNKMFEGILRPTPMGVMIPFEMRPEQINQNVLDYIDLRGIRLIRVKDVTSKTDEAGRTKAAEDFTKTFGSFKV